MKIDLSERARELKNDYQQKCRNSSPEAKERARRYQRKYYKNLNSEEKKSLNNRLRKWRKENPEKVEQHNIAYWNKKAVTDINVTASVTAKVTTCLECGKPFSGRAGAKFCNSTCRQRSHRKKI